MTSSRQIDANRRNAQLSTGPFDATSAVERELVLRLASLLWRLRRATAIESGLFRIQAERLLQFRQTRRAHHARQKIIDRLCRPAVATTEPAEMETAEDEPENNVRAAAQPSSDNAHDFDDLTRSYIRLANLPACPLDRLSRYEATLWRQACQILFTLQFMNRPKPWARARLA
jgi:hypothetical protein